MAATKKKPEDETASDENPVTKETKPVDKGDPQIVIDEMQRKNAELQKLYDQSVEANKRLTKELNENQGTEVQSLRAEAEQAKMKIAQFDTLTAERDSLQRRLNEYSSLKVVEKETEPHEFTSAWNNGSLSSCTVYKIHIDGSDEDAEFLLIGTNAADGSSGMFTHKGVSKMLHKIMIQKEPGTGKVKIVPTTRY